MTIDEAIKKEIARAEEWRNKVIQFGKTENKIIYMELAEECEQRAEWFKELKCYKDKRCITINLDTNSDEVKRLVADARIKAIDDFYSAMQADYSMKGLRMKRRKILKKAAGVKEWLKEKYLKGERT